MKFVLATHNPGKLKEMADILSGLGVEVVSPAELGIDVEVEETGSTFAENAMLKARAICDASGLPAIADDSGLCVDALNGGPGVYSARYGGEGLDDAARTRLLLENMRGQTTRAAHFACATAPSPSPPWGRGASATTRYSWCRSWARPSPSCRGRRRTRSPTGEERCGHFPKNSQLIWRNNRLPIKQEENHSEDNRTLPQMRQHRPAGGGTGAVQFFSCELFCQRKNSAVRLPQLRLHGGVGCRGIHGEAAAVLLA